MSLNCEFDYYAWLASGHSIILGESDGIVSLNSAINRGEDFKNIGISNNCHSDSLINEYDMVKKKVYCYSSKIPP